MRSPDRRQVAAMAAGTVVIGVFGAASTSALDPAHAQVVAYPDPVGDGTIPELDIVEFTGVITSTVIGGHMRVQNYSADITGQARATIYVDTNGDTEPDYRLERRPVDGSFWVYAGSSWDTVVCKAFRSSRRPAPTASRC